MLPIKQRTLEALQKLESFIASSPWDSLYSARVRALSQEIMEPCTLAVAGRVKAGKSSFINALLEEDLALVGNTETTATINVFRYGDAPNADRPIKCVWQNGMISWESRGFLDALQGHDLEVLQRAANIKYLEFYIKSPLLANNIRLVDTPGIGAYVPDDAHQKRTDSYFRLNEELRTRHTDETVALSATADAVIYLTDHVIQKCDSDFLGNFQTKSGAGFDGATAINVLGVIAQADRSSELMGTESQRKNFIKTEGALLAEQLALPIQIISISAGIQRALERFSKLEFESLQVQLKTGFSKIGLELALAGYDSEFYADDIPSCEISCETRKEIICKYSCVPWSVLKIIFNTLYNSSSIDEALVQLQEKSGFKEVYDILERHFFRRGEMLRCHSVISEIFKIVRELRNDKVYKYENEILGDQKSYPEFLDFIFRHPNYSPEDGNVGKLLQDFLDRKIPRQSDFNSLKTQLNDLANDLNDLINAVSGEKDNFEGLLLLEENPDAVSEEEKEELWRLFENIESGDKNFYCNREAYWRFSSNIASGSRRLICDLAEKQYQRINQRRVNDEK